MPQTMREYLTKIGLELGREEGREEGHRKALEQVLTSLRKALRRRGIKPQVYAKDLEKLSDPGKVADLVASFMAAKDPHAYLRRRFGH